MLDVSAPASLRIAIARTPATAAPSSPFPRLRCLQRADLSSMSLSAPALRSPYRFALTMERSKIMPLATALMLYGFPWLCLIIFNSIARNYSINNKNEVGTCLLLT